MKIRVSQYADGQGVLSLDGGPPNRKRDWGGDRGGGGDKLLSQFLTNDIFSSDLYLKGKTSHSQCVIIP